MAPKLRRIEYGVEQRLRELRDGGELSGLPGEGAPLPPDPDADAGDAWAVRHVVRTARVRPVWAELRAEIGERRARILTRLRAHLAWVERRNCDTWPSWWEADFVYEEDARALLGAHGIAQR